MPWKANQDIEPVVRLEMADEQDNQAIRQHEAIQAIAKTLHKGRAGQKDTKRSIGTFIFTGPNGAVQDDACEEAVLFLFGAEDALVPIAMSEYMKKHNVGRLIMLRPATSATRKAGS